MIPHCEVLPLPNHQFSFVIDGTERTRWHFGTEYPRPFFYPLRGPSGRSLTRMGHPGAPNHDHHQSIWFAHHKVLGIDFWSNAGGGRQIRQLEWLALEDGADAARMAVRLGWYDGHDPAPLLSQDLVAEVRRGPHGHLHETLLEIHARFTPTASSLEFQKTNFGFFAVRVAKNLSAYFGGGTLTNSSNDVGEPAIFGKPARWVDYSGPAANSDEIEGITYFDHPDNPGQPTHWHVREDGWMGASPCMHDSLEATPDNPLTVRYLLHAHGGGVEAEQANAVAEQFAGSAGFTVLPSAKKHTHMEISRL